MYFLLGISPASNCSCPTFRNPVSVPSSKAGCTVYTVQPAFEVGTDTGFRNVGQLQFDAGEIPRRKYTIFKSRRKSEIRNEFCFNLFLKMGVGGDGVWSGTDLGVYSHFVVGAGMG